MTPSDIHRIWKYDTHATFGSTIINDTKIMDAAYKSELKVFILQISCRIDVYAKLTYLTKLKWKYKLIRKFLVILTISQF